MDFLADSKRAALPTTTRVTTGYAVQGMNRMPNVSVSPFAVPEVSILRVCVGLKNVSDFQHFRRFQAISEILSIFGDFKQFCRFQAFSKMLRGF